jgi:hypothetical protein
VGGDCAAHGARARGRYHRSREPLPGLWGRSRVVIEEAIAKRQAEFRTQSTDEVLDGYQ